MTDIVYWSDEYKREIDQFASALNYYESLVDSLNSKIISKAKSDCDEKINRIKEVKKSYGLELRLVKDKAVKAENEINLKTLDDRVTVLTQKFKDIQVAQTKKQLVASSGGNSNPYDTTGKTNDELLSGANILQDRTEESLARTKNLIEQSKEVGTATIEQLRAQRDQIKDIEADIDRIESSMERAEKLVLDFTRRMATDRIIQGFFVLNVCMIISVVVYVLVSGKTLSRSKNDPFIDTLIGSSPTLQPTMMPTSLPTYITPIPTEFFTFAPTDIPSFKPTEHPSHQPTCFPTSLPSIIPTAFPSTIASLLPSSLPTTNPSSGPTVFPSSNPSSLPTSTVTANPSESPTPLPSAVSTVSPSPLPTAVTSNNPTQTPSSISSASPSPEPTSTPT